MLKFPILNCNLGELNAQKNLRAKRWEHVSSAAVEIEELRRQKRKENEALRESLQAAKALKELTCKARRAERRTEKSAAPEEVNREASAHAPAQRDLGTAYYKSSPNEAMHMGEIHKLGISTGLFYKGTMYNDAKEWIDKAFNNSGKSCTVQIERAQIVSTPRPKRYIPPNQKCSFGRYE